MQLIKYKTEVLSYQENCRIQAMCNSITFINKNTLGNILVNKYPVAPGESFVISGNANEINVSEYQLDFGTPIVGLLWVIKKTYL